MRSFHRAGLRFPCPCLLNPLYGLGAVVLVSFHTCGDENTINGGRCRMLAPLVSSCLWSVSPLVSLCLPWAGRPSPRSSVRLACLPHMSPLVSLAHPLVSPSAACFLLIGSSARPLPRIARLPVLSDKRNGARRKRDRLRAVIGDVRLAAGVAACLPRMAAAARLGWRWAAGGHRRRMAAGGWR